MLDDKEQRDLIALIRKMRAIVQENESELKNRQVNNRKEFIVTDFERLIEMITCYAEHIYDDTHGKDRFALNEKSAVDDVHYFDSIIHYGEQFLYYCKAAQALARAKEIIDED